MGSSGDGSRASHESSQELIRRARAGDSLAETRLCERYMEPLRRWASGRLPRWARSAVDTDDLVQEALSATVRNLESFDPRGKGAFHAYLRRALDNRIRDEVRRARTHPPGGMVAADLPSTDSSPLEQAIGKQALERYERALQRLKPDEREAILARVELKQTYAEIAGWLDKPSADAARMMVSRALVRLAREMGRER